MHNVFSADDFSDPFWQAAAAPPDATINRNASEWDLERFLREFPSSGSSSASDSTTTVPAQSPPSTKPENCDGDVIEIRQLPTQQLRNHAHAPALPHSQPHHVPQPLDRAPMATIDTEEYRAFLKSQLDLACAAVARTQTTAVKPPDFSPLAENHSPAPTSNSFHLGSQLPRAGAGLGIGNSTAQRQADHGSPGIQSLPASQKKQDVQTRQTTGGSSGDDSDDDDLEGDTGTNGAPADVKRSRRMLSNRESARRSRRRKQEQLNELETQAGQLRDERTTLLSRLTDVNHKCDEASVDNRVLKANIETLRAKVKMAEEQVKRVTGLNPLLLARSNIPPSMGMHHQYTGGHAVTANHQPFHHSHPNINPPVPTPHMQQPMHNSYGNNHVAVNGMNNVGGGMNSMPPFRPNEHHIPDMPSVPLPLPPQPQIGSGVNPRPALPVDASRLAHHGVAAKVDKKK